MKKLRKIIPVLLCLCLVFMAACTGETPLTEEQKSYNLNIARAKELTEKVNEKFAAYGDLNEKYYKEYMNEGSKAYLWSQFSLTGKQYAYIKAGGDEAAKELFTEQIDMFERYKAADSSDTFKKYHSGQGIVSGNGTVFFDDNIWGARNLLFAYDILGEQKYLDYAKLATDFVYTGWDEKLGGLVWNENGLTPNGGADDLERGLSANGAAVFVSLALYKITGEQKYLDWAYKFYDFCKTLQDPITKFYYNGRHTVVKPDGSRVDGSINKAAYSYNAGSMIIADIYFYEITKEEKYLIDAKDSAKAAFDVFAFKEGDITFINDFQWFNTVLLDSYVRLAKYDPENTAMYIKAFEGQLDYAYRKKRNADGLLPDKFFGQGWDDKSNKENYRLLIQAANAEQFSLLAQYYKNKISA